ncbi:PAS domain S-box protein [Pelatocladus sp. BLCC-F211]|uniref:GAF domain-containing sensor histidine kinase n=1 Tax=Pelatocladus sp. BLCC-F211 TaxID=3342752 RepID=UPI0035B6C6C6
MSKDKIINNLPAQSKKFCIKFLLQIVNAISDPIFVKDRQHCWVLLNDAFCRFTGFSREILIGKSDYDFFPEAEADVFWQKDELVFTTGITNENEEIFTDAQGIKHIIVTKKCLFDDGVGNLFLVGTIQNITEHKQAERLLAEKVHITAFHADLNAAITQNDNLQTVLKRCTDAMVKHLDAAFARIWTLNNQENVLELQVSSGMYTHINGPHRRVPVGMYKIGLIAEEQQPHLTNAVLEDPRVGDKEWAKREGMVAFAGYPLMLNGELFGVIAMFARQPLSESTLQILALAANEIALSIKRIQAETDLKESERKYRDLVESSQNLICSINTEGRFTFVNQAIRHIHGYEPEEMIGRLFTDFQPPEQIQKEQKNIQHVLAGESLFQYETVHFAKDHRRLNLLCNFIAQRDQAGNVIGAICTATDITERKQVETQLKQQTKDLEQALQKLQCTQIQLIQNEKMSSLGQLVAGVAHEINNPISFIYGNLTYAKEYIEDLLELVQLYRQYYPDPAPKIQAEIKKVELDFIMVDLPILLKSMNTGAERIREIVLSLRNFSRMDEAEMKEVDIHEGIDSTLMILDHRLKDQGDRIAIEIIKEYGNIPLVECYAGQINQVFMNILANAIDALEESLSDNKRPVKKPYIRIYTELNPDKQVIINIADNGLGIPDIVKQRLFDPFFTTKPIGKGTGMGLSISYQIITEKHGGSLKCISVPGIGAEFIIAIPLRQR